MCLQKLLLRCSLVFMTQLFCCRVDQYYLPQYHARLVMLMDLSLVCRRRLTSHRQPHELLGSSGILRASHALAYCLIALML